MKRGLLYLLVVLLGAGVAARAGADRDRLAQAREQYLGQEYERVIKLLAPLVNSAAATMADKIEAYELLGLSHLILGDTRSARAAFESLLGLDPAHVLRDPSGSPKLRRFFESVKARFVPGWKLRSPVTLEHAAPASAVAGRNVELGSPENPLGLEVAGRAPPRPRGEPFYKRWWFWTIVGAVVVGGATTGAVLGSRKTPPSGNLPPGVWQMP